MKLSFSAPVIFLASGASAFDDGDQNLLRGSIKGIKQERVQVRTLLPLNRFFLFQSSANKLLNIPNEKMHHRKLEISPEKKVSMQSEYMLQERAPLPVQYISSANTIVANEREYSLDGLSEYLIRGPDFVHTVDGAEVALPEQSSLWKGQDENGASIFMVKNESGFPTFIHIQDGNRESSIISMPGDFSGAMVAISADDYDYDMMNKMFHYGEDDDEATDSEDKTNTAFDMLDENGNRRAKSIDPEHFHRELQGCNTFTSIDVAIVYDSSFCSRYGGTATGAQSRIDAIVGMASRHYEVPGLCTTLRISDLEGYCDPNTDIYRDVIGSDNLLSIFREHWNSDRQSRPRDAAHLFSGTDFSDNDAVGRALTSTVCNLQAAYGIDWMTWTDDLNVQSLLFAHEVGHNAGAPHFGNENTGNIMNPVLNSGSNGFSSTSINNISSYLNQQSCLSTVNIGGGGGDGGGGNGGGTCGNGSRGDGTCADGTCCSQYGWCGTTAEHCGDSNPAPSPGGGTCGNGSRGDGACADGTCCSQYGWCGTTAEHCASGTCGNGSRGDGACADGTCCSQYGWCGTSAEHCSP